MTRTCSSDPSEIGPEPVPSEALAAYIETDRHGFKSFNYAGHSGALMAILDTVREKLDAAQRLRRAKDRAEDIAALKQYVDGWHEKNRRLQSEWRDFYPRHIEWRKQQRLAALEREKIPLRKGGGPTVADPERPYCKPDQSCCDFVCGN